MSDSKSKASSPEATYVEDDYDETVMGYGDGRGRTALVFIALVWTAYTLGLVSYMTLYYFPSLAEWQAW